MKNSLLYLFLLLVSYTALSQKEPREILRGRIVADSIAVENISVNNLTSNIGAVTDHLGNFAIYARPADTLQFSGLTIRDARLVLKKEHFYPDKLVVKLDVNVTQLDEVIISPLTGNLEQDSRNKKVATLSPNLDSGSLVKNDVKNNLREYKYSEEKNMLTDPVNREMHGLNFAGLYRLFFKPKKKDKGDQAYKGAENFTDAVRSRFTYHFFTQTLKIPKDEIGLFLNFCDSGPSTRQLLVPGKEFELTDYLVGKSIEYHKQKK
jgi:hypothetical protein